MIKEYIDKLAVDNQTELSKLEKQMQGLIDELTYAQEWHENLQKESNALNNIFSPRSIDDNMEENIENAQNKIANINQQIEYTRDKIETHLKKKSEYITLKQEIDFSSKKAETRELLDKSMRVVTERELSEDKVAKNSAVDDELMKQIKSLLNEIYKKSDICLATLNSNKTRCKMELNEIKKMIRQFAEKIS